MEDFVCTVRDHIMELSLVRGYDLVIDDTNLDEKHITAIECTAARHDATIEIVDFTHVPLEECLKRNSTRKDKDPIPEQAIIDMYNKYLAGKEVM